MRNLTNEQLNETVSDQYPNEIDPDELSAMQEDGLDYEWEMVLKSGRANPEEIEIMREDGVDPSYKNEMEDYLKDMRGEAE